MVEELPANMEVACTIGFQSDFRHGKILGVVKINMIVLLKYDYW